MGNSDSSNFYADAYIDCLKSHGNSWSKCSSYRHMLHECQDRAHAANGPRSIKVVAAAPTDNSDPCHFHTKAYVACLNNSKVPLGKCMDCANMYNECCWRLDDAAGAKGDMIDSTARAKDPVNDVTVAAPVTKVDPCPGMKKGKSCDIHSKAFDDCFKNYRVMEKKCKHYRNILDECRRIGDRQD